MVKLTPRYGISIWVSFISHRWFVTFGLAPLINSSEKVKLISPSAAYMRQRIGPALVQIMACRLFGAKPLSKPMLGYCQLDP